MARNTSFLSPVHKRILESAQATPQEGSVTGPITTLNPTQARFPLPTTSERPISKEAYIEWRARDNRKGRHSLVVPKGHQLLRITHSAPAILQGIRRMFTFFAWWDISWWIAVLFSVGSAIFVICGLFDWLPLAAPDTEFTNETQTGAGVTAFVGATLFEVGAVLLIVEAVNENQTGCFGWALDQAMFGTCGESENGNAEQPLQQPRNTPTDCRHHHSKGLHRGVSLQHPDAGRKWEWWPTWHELTTHYFWEIGFLGSFLEATGATVFYVSGIMSLPGIYNQISKPVLDGTYWLAYLIGGILFIISSFLYMVETQKEWYQPAPSALGWWIGLWNLVGSVGWTLSAAFGYCHPSWCAYQSNLSLLWASFAFLLGSLLLWYEALDKYPVVQAK